MSVLVAALPDRLVNELWWVGVIESALVLFFGISAIFWPGLTLLTLVYMFSAFVLGIGLIQLTSGIMSFRRRGSWWVTALIGALSIGIGVYLVRHPDLSLATFLTLIGLLLVVRGLLDLMRAIFDRASTLTRVLLGMIGAAGIIAGTLIWMQPVAGGVAFVWILGVYALVVGSFGLAMAFELRTAWLQDQAAENGGAEERRSGRTRPRAA
jgi:uncharacterized membrane protein HdeD (DUF308 family)